MTTEQTPELFPEELTWRETLPEVFRPIAARWGKHKFYVAWHAGASQEALNNLTQAAGNNKMIVNIVGFAAAAANQLAMYALESQQMTIAELQEIQRDIERGAALAGATNVQPNDRIVLPN